MGRPPFAPTDDQRALVGNLVSFGYTQDQICRLVIDKPGRPIAEMTLRKHFHDELEQGSPKANAQVLGGLFRQAVDGNLTARNFLAKNARRLRLTRSED